MNMIHEFLFHRWRDAHRLMNPTEVVIEEIGRHHVLMVL